MNVSTTKEAAGVGTKLTYKGYSTTAQWSVEDECLFGYAEDMPKGTSMSFEGSTLEELEQDFHNAVDSYLDVCREEGVTPVTSKSHLK